MIPSEVVKPSSLARRATTSASSGLRTPLPITELIVTVNWRSSASQRSFGARRRRLFIEASSGSTLSIEICRWSRPAWLSFSIRSRDRK
jgi:hypothetical protein